MRRTRIAAATVMVGAGLIGAVAAPASAATEYHFKLFEKLSFHGVENPSGELSKGFRYKGKVFDPQSRDNRVGRDRGKCKFRPHATTKCKGTLHLNGEIGGLGSIEYRGKVGPRDNTSNVVGGSGDFDGATGKTKFRNLNPAGTKEMTKWDFVVP